MSGNTVSPTTVNGVPRFSGLSSGIDVDSIVKKLILADSGTLNQLKQTKQIDAWKQEQYQDIIGDLNTFTSKYLDLTSADSLLNESTFQQFKVDSSDDSSVSATAGGDAVPGSHTISVEQLAAAASQASVSGVSKDVAGSAKPDYADLKGKSFTINVDGTTRTVTFDTAYDPNSQTGVQYVQAAINKAIGTTTDKNGNTINKVTVSEDRNGYLQFVPTANSGVGSIAISDADSNGAFSILGFKDGSILSNRLDTGKSLAEIANQLKSPFQFDAASGEIAFTINGEKFSFDKDDTLGDMIRTINKDKNANVTMKYDANTDQLAITANETGAGKTLDIADTTGNFVSTVLTDKTDGQDAKVVLDGQELTRSSNSFTQDGITYTLKAKTKTDATVSVTQDEDGIYSKISNFIKDYNALIQKMNDKISESYDRNYPPLTDQQTSSMSDTEITNWNNKAQAGLLQNDSTLQNLLYNMRSALMSSVQGQSENLAKLGITTGAYTEKGQLHIDEAKLKQAISNDPKGVMALFTQQSTSYSGTVAVRTLDSSARSIRTQEEGLAYKLYDILQDNIGTVRDSNGNKGLLLQKSGMKDDASDTDNILTKDIDTLADKITAEQNRLDNETDRYYSEFTNMETVLEQLSSQSSMLASFSGS